MPLETGGALTLTLKVVPDFLPAWSSAATVIVAVPLPTAFRIKWVSSTFTVHIAELEDAAVYLRTDCSASVK
ncbi:hypothetical protein D3C81_813210 [compost metagenome]